MNTSPSWQDHVEGHSCAQHACSSPVLLQTLQQPQPCGQHTCRQTQMDVLHWGDPPCVNDWLTAAAAYTSLEGTLLQPTKMHSFMVGASLYDGLHQCLPCFDVAVRILLEANGPFLAGLQVACALVPFVIPGFIILLPVVLECTVARNLPSPQAAVLIRPAVVWCGLWILCAHRGLIKCQHVGVQVPADWVWLLLVILEGTQGPIALPAPRLQGQIVAMVMISLIVAAAQRLPIICC